MFKRNLTIAVMALLLTGAGGAPVVPPLITPSPTANPGETPLLSHRALYKMSIASVRNGSAVTGATGSMYYQWSDACDGWLTEQRMNTTFVYNEAEEANISSTYTTWEAKDGTQFRFNVKRKTNDQLTENFKGTAETPAPGQAGKAHYTVPEALEVDIPAGSYFPTAHTMALIRVANESKPMFNATVFDGSEGRGLSDISAAIGASRPVVDEAIKTGNQPDRMWPVRMAFYTTNDQSPEPQYEMDSTMLPNGLTQSMLLDYGDFKLKATLEKVELLPVPKC